MYTQWNPSITDTIETSNLVLLLEVSFVEGSFNIIKYQNGTRKVSLVVRSPLYGVTLYYVTMKYDERCGYS